MRLTNYNAAAARLLPLAVCAVLAVAALVARSVAPLDTVTTVLLVFAVTLVPVGLLPALVLPFFAVFWIDLDDEVRIRRLLGTRRAGWAQVAGARALDVQTQVTLAHLVPVPLARHVFLELQLEGGRRYRVKVSEPTLREVDALLRRRGVELRRG